MAFQPNQLPQLTTLHNLFDRQEICVKAPVLICHTDQPLGLCQLKTRTGLSRCWSEGLLNAILWKTYSSNSKTTAVLSPDTRRKPPIFMPFLV